MTRKQSSLPAPLQAFTQSLFDNPSRLVDLLLIFVPVSIVLALLRANETLIFITAALGIIPLAGLLGEATDTLAVHAGDRVGALLNATFGNAAELIITIAAINAGLIEVVKASITGSIIGNILLVLGLSVLLGGLKNGFQRFDRRSISTMMTTLAIAVIGLVIPAVFGHAIEDKNHFAIEYLSIGVAIALMVGYILSLLFTFRLAQRDRAKEGGEQAEEEALRFESVRLALGVLVVGVIFVAILSEILVNAVEPLIRAQGLTELFVGVIVVPIIGNAAEHLVAVEMAMKNKMEIAVGVALGSSLQIALFVAPLLVFISLAFGHELTLVFNQFELAALGAAVVIAALISLDGESNWLEGAQLLIVYVILALAFFFLPA
jgi:Ca2+:H+ antiporter